MCHLDQKKFEEENFRWYIWYDIYKIIWNNKERTLNPKYSIHMDIMKYNGPVSAIVEAEKHNSKHFSIKYNSDLQGIFDFLKG